MKNWSLVSLAALLISAPLSSQMLGVAQAQQQTQILAQNILPQRKVQLNLLAQKQVVQKDTQGKQKVTWQALQGKGIVQPGDVIRYTVSGANNSDRPIKNLVVTQPIPQRTMYVLNSTTVKNEGATITYSIDKGKTFVAKPIIRVKLANGKVETQPAPANMYTHVRWKFEQPINPKTAVNAAYQVRVR